MPDLHKTTNRILTRLSRADNALLSPHLEAVELPLRKRLEDRKKPITHVYFMESGFASVVATDSHKHSIEVGIIGREGVTGLAVLMGTDRSPHDTFIQLAGSAQRMPASKLRAAMQHSASLRQTLLQYGHSLVAQMAYTALANGRSKIEERLARWLLMAHDRLDGEDVTLTHEFLAIMLGVRRPGVTVALNLLESRGLIQTTRGAISIVDRQGLAVSSKGAYGAAEAEFNRLFG